VGDIDIPVYNLGAFPSDIDFTTKADTSNNRYLWPKRRILLINGGFEENGIRSQSINKSMNDVNPMNPLLEFDHFFPSRNIYLSKNSPEIQTERHASPLTLKTAIGAEFRQISL
jgi:hypothetical protein